MSLFFFAIAAAALDTDSNQPLDLAAVHVDVDPELNEDMEQTIATVITTAGDIVNELKKSSPDVVALMRQLKASDANKYKRFVIESQLRHEFEAALKQNVPEGLVTPLASLLARSTVSDILFLVAVLGDSIVIYFLSGTVEASHELDQMIQSGFVRDVFAQIIEFYVETPVTVHVYITTDQVDPRGTDLQMFRTVSRLLKVIGTWLGSL